MIKLDNHDLARLARDVAMNITPQPELLTKYNLTQPEFDEVIEHPYFKRAVDAMIIEWNKPLTTPERIKLTSQAGFEESLMAVTARARDPTEPLTATVEVMKLLARIGGLDSEKAQQAVAPADRFVITINLGADVEHYDKPIAVGIDDTAPKTLPAAPAAPEGD